MIKALAKGNELLILGLSRGNVERLVKGDPIFFKRDAMPGLGHAVLIVFGETEDQVLEDLEKKMGLRVPKGRDA